MRIELKTKTMLGNVVFARGEVADVSDEEGKALVACSYAKETTKAVTNKANASAGAIAGATSGDDAAAAAQKEDAKPAKAK